MPKYMLVGRGNGPKRLKQVATTLSSDGLRRSIEELDPVRKILFEALMLSRRRAAKVEGCADDNPSMLVLVRDAYAYARDVGEPEIELAEIRALNNRVHPGASSSLAEGAFLYAGTE